VLGVGCNESARDMTMGGSEWLAESFEENRRHLQGVAYRMLGSLSEADDAVQETWLRLSRSDTNAVENLRGWLTTVVSRVCLDMLRSRQSRREESLEADSPEPIARREGKLDPEKEVVLADSVGLALLVVLDRLSPAERLAFVLHDLFAVSFDEIAKIVGRSPTAARQLASRARRRVRGADSIQGTHLTGQRKLVETFLTALRAGDVDALLALLDPDFLVRADQAAGAFKEVRGARAWAEQAVHFTKGVRFARPALVDGAVGVVVAPRGRLFRVLTFTFRHGKILQVDVVADPQRLRELDLALLDD
jgi:RNA polymerase sigma factor (sigma-70 family)